jgi:hypothetical protein
MRQRQQNSSAYSVTFFLVAAADHIAGLAGASPVVTISKNGAAFAAAAGAITEVGSGWYAWAGHASDRSALGELAVHITASGADPVDFKLEIVPWNPFDANLGLSRLDDTVTSRAAAVDYTAVRAAKLDNLDATTSSRSTLTAAAVWANATRTITGTGTGAITAASFAADAIDAAALAAGAVTEIQAGLATLANQTSILGYVDELESRLTTARAAKLDNLDVAVSSRSTLAASDVWSYASRTLSAFSFSVNVGSLSAGAITSAAFAAGAINASALASDAIGSAQLASTAVTEIQTGLGTLANQTMILAYVDELESRLSAPRAANLDNLDATISSRLAASAYVVPDNTSIGTIEAVLSGITNLADWLRAIIRQDAADVVAKSEINAVGGTYNEALHSLSRTASLAELLEADRYIDTAVTPWALVLTRKNTGGPGVGVELLRQRLFTETGTSVTSIDTFVGRSAA